MRKTEKLQQRVGTRGIKDPSARAKKVMRLSLIHSTTLRAFCARTGSQIPGREMHSHFARSMWQIRLHMYDDESENHNYMDCQDCSQNWRVKSDLMKR